MCKITSRKHCFLNGFDQPASLVSKEILKTLKITPHAGFVVTEDLHLFIMG